MGLLCPQGTRDWGWTGILGVTLGPLFVHIELQETSDLADFKALWGRQG